MFNLLAISSLKENAQKIAAEDISDDDFSRAKKVLIGKHLKNFNSVDNIVTDEVTFIKMDIEGAELKALEGARNTVKKYKPKLYVCAYHRNEDMFTIPFKIKELYEGYKIYFRQHPYIPAWESNFYAIAEE